MPAGMTWMWMWWIPAAIVLGLLAYAAARLLRPGPTPYRPFVAASREQRASSEAQRLLEERYAKGEVDEQQYVQTRDRLRNS